MTTTTINNAEQTINERKVELNREAWFMSRVVPQVNAINDSARFSAACRHRDMILDALRANNVDEAHNLLNWFFPAN